MTQSLPSPDDASVRTVFVVSDGTGITAETFAHAVLAQFDSVRYRNFRIPFINTLDKADEVAHRIEQAYQADGVRPIVFSTLVNPEINTRVRQANALFMDLFFNFVEPIENELG